MNMEFTVLELRAIERACRGQALNDRALAENTGRPLIRNGRLDSAQELGRIAEQIEQDRRRRALASRQCPNCED